MDQPLSTQPERNIEMPGKAAQQDGTVRFYPMRHQQLNHWLALPAGTLLILMSAAALLYAFFTTWTAVERHGRAVILKTLPLPLLVFILALTLGLVILVTTSRHWNDGIEFTQSGIIFQRGKNSKSISWESITRLDARVNVVKFATSVVNVQSRAEIEDNKGLIYLISDQVTDSQDLINRCREKVLPRLFQDSQKALQKGGKISFHRNLTATRQALLIKRMPYNWQDVTLIFKKRKITLQERSSKRDLISLPINKLKNADILLALLENPPR